MLGVATGTSPAHRESGNSKLQRKRTGGRGNGARTKPIFGRNSFTLNAIRPMASFLGWGTNPIPGRNRNSSTRRSGQPRALAQKPSGVINGLRPRGSGDGS